MEKNYYKILEIPENADTEMIKKAYRKLAKKYHPDTNSGSKEAEIKFQDVNEAYSVLSDDEKRKEYDEKKNNKSRDFGGKTKSKGSSSQGANPFAGFSAENFKMDFGDMMFDELNKNKGKKSNDGNIDFSDVSSQFANFFGFKPK